MGILKQYLILTGKVNLLSKTSKAYKLVMSNCTDDYAIALALIKTKLFKEDLEVRDKCEKVSGKIIYCRYCVGEQVCGSCLFGASF